MSVYVCTLFLVLWILSRIHDFMKKKWEKKKLYNDNGITSIDRTCEHAVK